PATAGGAGPPLPLLTGEKPAPPRPRAEHPDEVELPRHRVLVVDDSADAARSLSMLLRLWKQDVRAAHDGTSGLALAEEFRPEVAILDIGMPGMDGHELARRLR